MASSILTTNKRVQLKGVVYDVGLNFSGTGFSVEPFDPALVECDMHAIATQLHANAVRIEGEDIERLATAAQAAHNVGLTVYLNPWKMNATAEQTMKYLAEAARAAEQLRIRDGVDIVLLVGCEYTIFSKGCFPGDSFAERCAWLGTQLSQDSGATMTDPPQAMLEKSKELNEILRTLVRTARAEIGGLLSYSAGSWERVDWSQFDVVGIDYYRRGEPAEEYISGLDRYRVGKPLVVMEMGCCAYEGAAIRGDGGFVLLKGVNADGSGMFQDDVIPTRSEEEQAGYIETQLGLLQDQGLHGVFVFVFSFPSLRAGKGNKDLDMMGFSLVKTFPADDPRSKTMPPWAPKEAFHRLATVYEHTTSAIL